MSDTHILDSNIVVSRARDIIFQQFDNELLAVDAEAGYCFSLNESAGRVWMALETPASLNVICERLCAEYNVDEETCLHEVSALLINLNQAGLVIIHDSATP